MSLTDALKFVGWLLWALGGGGAVVLAFSDRIGKVWAERYAQKHQHRHERELEELRAEFEVWKAKATGAHEQKVAIYQSVITIVAHIVTEIEAGQQSARVLTPDEAVKVMLQFERDRLRAYGYLALLAPQTVMDANDAVMDYLGDVFQEKRKFVFAEFRIPAIAMLNAMRSDLGIGVDPIEYRGAR